MPCVTYTESERLSHAHADLSELRAMLCGVLTAASRLGMYHEILDRFDEKEAGVSKASLDLWWQEHQVKDAKRRKEEAAEKKRRAAAERALAKLTPEDRRALGLNW